MLVVGAAPAKKGRRLQRQAKEAFQDHTELDGDLSECPLYSLSPRSTQPMPQMLALPTPTCLIVPSETARKRATTLLVVLPPTRVSVGFHPRPQLIRHTGYMDLEDVDDTRCKGSKRGLELFQKDHAIIESDVTESEYNPSNEGGISENEGSEDMDVDLTADEDDANIGKRKKRQANVVVGRKVKKGVALREQIELGDESGGSDEDTPVKPRCVP